MAIASSIIKANEVGTDFSVSTTLYKRDDVLKKIEYNLSKEYLIKFYWNYLTQYII